MPRLKKLFRGRQRNELEPLQYKYLTRFQTFLEERHPDIHQHLKNVHAKTTSAERPLMKRWVAAKFMGTITGGLELGDLEWLGACCAIQWLGTDEGQEFLASI